MTIPPLCIIQARMGSTRLPGKMLLTLGGMSLIERAWRTACQAFGRENVVIAHPDTPENKPLVSHIDAMLAERFAWDGPENDVLGRFHACAHRYRWRPDSVIVRYTPEDFRKDACSLRRVAAGERLPVEVGGEAFTLAMLDEAQARTPELPDPPKLGYDAIRSSREHLTYTLFRYPPPPCPPGCWTIDTSADLDAARAWESKQLRRAARHWAFSTKTI